MVTPAGQAKAQALNAKLEGDARMAIDDIEKQFLRKEARKAYACSVTCYDKAGTTGPVDSLEACVRQCQIPYQQANQVVQVEVGNYQNRLDRAMSECQNKARDIMKPGDENDAKRMQKIEDALLGCMSQTVNEYVGLLRPMRERVAAQMKEISK